MQLKRHAEDISKAKLDFKNEQKSLEEQRYLMNQLKYELEQQEQKLKHESEHLNKIESEIAGRMGDIGDGNFLISLFIYFF